MTSDNVNFKQSRSDHSHQPHLQEEITGNRDTGFSRREFVGIAAASLVMAGTLNASAADESNNGIPYRTLGRTGERVSVIGLCGYTLGKQSEPEESSRTIRSGLDGGVNSLA